MPVAVTSIHGSLLEVTADAIVNPWNRNVIPRWLLAAGGVSGTLKKTTGPAPWRELARKGPLALGQAVETSPGHLRTTKAIIHVAGLNLAWRATPESVRSSVTNAILLAHSRGHRTIAIPLVGAGHGGLGEKQSRDLTLTALQSPQLDDININVLLVEYSPHRTPSTQGGHP